MYKELNQEIQNKYFNQLNKKYIHNIDNIYYSCFITNDNEENIRVQKLINDLLECKRQMMQSYEETPFKYGLIYEAKRHATYGLCITSKDRYDIFVDEFYRNEKTPRILIKIRSMPLWIEPIDKVLEETLKTLDKVLSDYNLSAQCTRENRIDYCYHTNYIQNPRKHFKDEVLESTLVTTMKSYGVQGKIKRQFSKTKLTKDYICFGNRKSNNVFIRIYNKTREVIEQGYKAFFIHKWYEHKLISFYDKYCLEYAFEHKNYDKLHTARLNFYLQYGQDKTIKKRILDLLNNEETTRQDIEAFADLIMPKVTIICNIEFETKRKFYYYSDKQINALPLLDNSKDYRLHRLFKIIDNRVIFLNYINHDLMTYEKNGKTCSWWKRLQECKIKSVSSKKDELSREYNKNLNEKLVKRKFINNVASLSVYSDNNDTDFTTDICDVLSNMNDNHTQYGLVSELGVLGEEISSELLRDYQVIKDKKNRLLKNRK
jgi:hypothetical protein